MRKTLVALAVLLAACSDNKGINSHDWSGEPSQPISQYQWHQVSPKELQAHCNTPTIRTNAACVIRVYGHVNGPTCLVYSDMSEQAAHNATVYTITGFPQVLPWGERETLWLHEVKGHCYLGLNHPMGAK